MTGASTLAGDSLGAPVAPLTTATSGRGADGAADDDRRDDGRNSG